MSLSPHAFWSTDPHDISEALLEAGIEQAMHGPTGRYFRIGQRLLYVGNDGRIEIDLHKVADMLAGSEAVREAQPPCLECGDPIDYCIGHGVIG